MSLQGNDADAIEALVQELRICRRRGLESLEATTHNQQPVDIPVLERLARDFALARHYDVPGRIAQIRNLLRHGIDALAAADPARAALIQDLYIGEPQSTVVRRASVLLDAARRKTNLDAATFQEAYRAALRDFAPFLFSFARAGADPPVAAQATPPWAAAAGPREAEPGEATERGLGRREILTGYVIGGERFIRTLSEATSVTIIGLTNEHLASMLTKALAMKREREHRQDAFWGQLRIVVLQDQLLDRLNDQRPEYPDPLEVQRQRRQAAFYGRRSISALLRRTKVERWELYESPYWPPFIGSLLEMPDGRRVLNLVMRHPDRIGSDQLSLWLEDTADHYFSSAFAKVVRSSISDRRSVPIGEVNGDTFARTGTRYRHRVLQESSRASGWLPLVLVITWQLRDGSPWPVFQLRCEDNSDREINRLGNMSSHIYEDDYGGSSAAPVEFGLRDEGPRRAAQRRIRGETSGELVGEIHPRGTYRYLNARKENLLIFVFTCELPAGLRFPERSEIYHVPVSDLLLIRANQVLRTAMALLRAPAMSQPARAAATEIVALNLTLHDRADLARRLRAALGPPGSDRAELADLVARLEERSRMRWESASHPVQLEGFPGLQYREFFTMLLPLYAQIGVAGAAEQLTLIEADSARRDALNRLAEMYQDTALMAAIPIEL